MKEPIWFRAMPFQQVAWYFKVAKGYVVISEIHWNTLLYYMTGPSRWATQRALDMVVSAKGNRLTLELILMKDLLPSLSDFQRRDLSLVCCLFFQNDVARLSDKLDIVVDKTYQGMMQTTVEWKGLHLDLKDSLLCSSHRFIDPFEKHKRGGITLFMPELCAEPNSVMIMESDTRLNRWKEAHPKANVISSKKRKSLRPEELEGAPLGCHYMKSGLLHETGRCFDVVYITQQCFDAIQHLPMAHAYVMCVDTQEFALDKKYIDPRTLRLFGVSDDAVTAVLKDGTGILFYLLIASCMSPVIPLEKEERGRILTSFHYREAVI